MYRAVDIRNWAVSGPLAKNKCLVLRRNLGKKGQIVCARCAKVSLSRETMWNKNQLTTSVFLQRSTLSYWLFNLCTVWLDPLFHDSALFTSRYSLAPAQPLPQAVSPLSHPLAVPQPQVQAALRHLQSPPDAAKSFHGAGSRDKPATTWPYQTATEATWSRFPPVTNQVSPRPWYSLFTDEAVKPQIKKP